MEKCCHDIQTYLHDYEIVLEAGVPEGGAQWHALVAPQGVAHAHQIATR